MKPGLLLVVVAMIPIACVDGSPPSSAPGETAPEDTVQDETTLEIDVYSAVIRQLVTKDHTFGGESPPFKVVYVINGAVTGAGKPRGDVFGPAPHRFGQDLIDGIRERLRDDLPPLRFIVDGNEFRRGPDQLGGVKNDGVIISLGLIERKRDRVRVPNTLWCGGRCGQWLTYVLAEKNGRWVITGTSGPVAVS